MAKGNKKNDWLEKLKVNEGNLKNFNDTQSKKNKIKFQESDDELSFPDKLSLSVNKDFTKRFTTLAEDYYSEIKRLDQFNYTNYFRLVIDNLDEVFKIKYEKIQTPNEQEYKFFKKTGRINNLDSNLYPTTNKNSESYSIGSSYRKKFVDLMFTYYQNEINNIKLDKEAKGQIKNYSIQFFFYDVVRILESKNLKLKFFEYENSK